MTARSVLTIGLLLVGLAACADDGDDAGDARETMCDARGDLRSDLAEMFDELREGDLDAAREEIDDASTALEELGDGFAELTSAQREAVQPHLDSIRTAIGSIDLTALGSVPAALETVQREIGEAVDAIGGDNALECP